jgi:peptidyl-prolyl cis-trans isomerase SurA
LKTLFRFAILFVFMGIAIPAQAQDSLRIAAVVNDEVISLLDVSMRIRMILVSSQLEDTPEIRQRLMPQVLRGLIDEKLRLQEAERLGVTIPQEEIDSQLALLAQQNNMTLPQFETVLNRNGILLDTVATQIHADLAWARLVRMRLSPSITVSEDEIDETLARIAKNQGKPEYLVSEVFLSIDSPDQEAQVRAVAERLIAEIRRGADFSAVARQFSQSATAAAGGDIGWVGPGQLSPPLDAAIRAMQPGQVSAPIRDTGGLHILALRDQRRAGMPEEGTVSLKQVFLPLPASAPDDAVAEANAVARSVVERAKNCSDMTRVAREVNPNGNVDLANVRINELPDILRPIAYNLPIGEPSEPLRVETGIGIFMVCERHIPEASLPSRDEIAERIGRERLDLLARGYMRDLRRAAFVDLRV